MDSYYQYLLLEKDREIKELKQQITELKSLQSEGLGLYRRLIDESHYPIFLIYGGRIKFINKAFSELFGVQESDLQNGIFSFNKVLGKYDQLDTTDPVFRVTNQNGDMLYIEVHTSYITIDNSLATQGIIRDVTDKILAIESLLKTKDYLERFAYSVSHDLQEPLRLIELNLSYLEFTDGFNADDLIFVHEAIKNLNRVSKMITGLFEYSHITYSPIKIKEVDLTRLVKKLISIRDLSMMIEKRNAEVDIKSLPIIKTDDGLMNKLFYHLIENGILYNTSDKPLISIYYHNGFLYVSDNGIGIDKKLWKDVFQIFKRVDPNSERAGVGLSICQRIVENMRGSIWIETSDNLGTTICFEV